MIACSHDHDHLHTQRKRWEEEKGNAISCCAMRTDRLDEASKACREAIFWVTKKLAAGGGKCLLVQECFQLHRAAMHISDDDDLAIA